jgi:transposase InsO family protein
MVRSLTSFAPLQFLVLTMAGWVQRRQADAIDYLRAENRVLRGRLGPSRLRFTDAERRLLAEKGRRLGRQALEEIASVARPETILRWYRALIAAKYDGSGARSSPGRPTSSIDKVSQLLTMARENPSWGYTRLRGALANLGLHLGRSTIRRILKEHGVEPAPVRGRTLSWRTFLKLHWDAIAAADFFSVEVLTRGGLVRYLVFFAIELKTRRVHIAGVASDPGGAWMVQLGRNLTDAALGFLKDARHLIVDRDPLYTAQFEGTLKAAGVQLVRMPPCSPNLNAFAERFVRSVRQECLRHVVPLGERHLRHLLAQYVEHYHHERNHQGIGNVIPLPEPRAPAAVDGVQRRQRLGGILNFYVRQAA